MSAGHAPFFDLHDITTGKIVWVLVDAVAAVADQRVELLGGQTLRVVEDEDAIMTRIEDQFLTYEEILARKAEKDEVKEDYGRDG